MYVDTTFIKCSTHYTLNLFVSQFISDLHNFFSIFRVPFMQEIPFPYFPPENN